MLTKQITALAIAFGLLFRGHALAVSPVTQPCDLESPSRLVAATEFMDDRGSGSVILGDNSGNELQFHYSAGVAHFKVNKGAKIESRAGSAEERCILDLLRQGIQSDVRLGATENLRCQQRRIVLPPTCHDAFDWSSDKAG